MKKIFWGLLFLLVEIKLGRLPITPLVGYLLIWCGLGKVPESETFRRTGKVAAVAVVFTGLEWLKNLLGVSIGDPYIGEPLVGLVMMATGLAF